MPSKPCNGTRFDLVVIGATPGGIACAVRAAREGLTVLLTNWNDHPGGFFVNGGRIQDTLYEGDRAPLYTEFVDRVRQYNLEKYGEESEDYRQCFFGDRLESGARPKVSNEAAAAVFDEWIQFEANITLLTGVFPAAVERSERLLRAVYLESTLDHRRTRMEGEAFIDATYEGDLAAVSGVEYRVGRESREEFGEPHAGKIFTWRGEEGHFPREAAEGLINTRIFRLTNKQVFAGSTGEGDGAIQAYNYRMQLTNDPEKRKPVTPPENYDRSRYLGIVEKESEVWEKSYAIKSDALYHGVEKVGMNGQHHCFPGGNHEYPDADWEERRRILKAHADHMLGYFYFLQNDEAVPEEIRNRNQEWGLDKTLYPDNDNIPYEIYVREARRIRGRYVFREQDATLADGYARAPIHSDSIAITEWPMDSHDCTTDMVPGSLHDGVLLLTEETRPGQIPYRTLLPKDLDNLIVPICLSATHVAWGTVRLEPVWMHVGEVAAYAVGLSIRNNSTPGKLSGEQLQFTLVENGIMVSFFNEFDMATEEPWVPAVQYLGTKGFFDAYDARPEAPLTVPVAREWAHAFGSLCQGNCDAHVVAGAVHRVADVAEPAISVAEFLTLLEKEAAYHELPDSLISREAASMELNEQESLARKDACRLIFALIRQILYPSESMIREPIVETEPDE